MKITLKFSYVYELKQGLYYYSLQVCITWSLHSEFLLFWYFLIKNIKKIYNLNVKKYLFYILQNVDINIFQITLITFENIEAFIKWILNFSITALVSIKSIFVLLPQISKSNFKLLIDVSRKNYKSEWNKLFKHCYRGIKT